MSSGAILFAGDVALKTSPVLSQRLQELIRQCDIASCNFEAPIEGIGKPVTKSGPHVSQIAAAPQIVEQLGFNVISLANNHVHDYGDDALDATIDTFKSSHTVGAGSMDEAYALKKINVSDTVVGFLSFGEAGFGALTGSQRHSKGYAWINHRCVNELIGSAKKEVDILIVQAHAGVEQIDLPLPEWRSRYKELIGCGADAVVAHHPHVPQGWESYDGRPVFYSLGNFYFDLYSRHPLWNTGLLAVIRFANKKITGWHTYITKRTGCEVDVVENEEMSAYLIYLNHILEAPQYMEQMNLQILQLWNKIYKHHYNNVFNGINTYTPYRFLKHLKRMASFKGINYTLLWHNLFIESNKWAVERAISLKNKL
ncbi:MAG: CapA family protein [Prevotellaceae bacterium]|jgi:poly-gamma-glutamate synthesis protein (capsule biosynthesis protein)|nr:CapA family protein [Prevotellaceae bacterium]